MVKEMMMVPTTDYTNLVNYYKRRLAESALLAAERQMVLKNPKIPTSVALAMAEPKAIEVQRLTKRLRSAGVSGPSLAEIVDDDEDDFLSKLKKILRATTKRAKIDEGGDWVELIQPPSKTPQQKKKKKTPAKPKKQTKKGGWQQSLKQGAIKGLSKHLGFSLSDGDAAKGKPSDQSTGSKSTVKKKPAKRRTPRAVRRLRAAPGWEDFTEGRRPRRLLLPPNYDASEDTTETYNDDEEEGDLGID